MMREVWDRLVLPLLVIGSLALVALAGLSFVERPVVTRATYDQLAFGATLAQVQAQVGHAGQELEGEDAPGHSQRTWRWENPDGSSATLTFVDGRLSAKGFERLK